MPTNDSTAQLDYGVGGEYMTVAEFIAYLQTQQQDLQVAHEQFSEQLLLDTDDIKIKQACEPRSDGWIQNKRDDMPTQTYLMLPGN